MLMLILRGAKQPPSRLEIYGGIIPPLLAMVFASWLRRFLGDSKIRVFFVTLSLVLAGGSVLGACWGMIVGLINSDFNDPASVFAHVVVGALFAGGRTSS